MKPPGKKGKLLGNNEQRVARRIICAPTDGVSATFVIDLMMRNVSNGSDNYKARDQSRAV